MAIRREILLIVLLLLVIALLVKLVEFFQVNVVEADASNFVLEDLQTRYPAADIQIMTITPMYNERGGRYFELKAKVTEDAESPCPRRSHLFYNYPVQNFVPQQPEIITSNDFPSLFMPQAPFYVFFSQTVHYNLILPNRSHYRSSK